MSQGESVQFLFAGLAFFAYVESCALLQVLSIPLAQHLWPTPREKQLHCLHIRSYPNPKGFKPKRACMHTLMVSSCECVLIKLVASSQNSASRRTLPKVQDLFQGSLVIKNEASTFCKIEILCIRLRALKKPSFGGIVKRQSFVKASFHCNGKFKFTKCRGFIIASFAFLKRS